MLRPEVSLARRLRRAMSLPEVLLRQRLRRMADGTRFRRQHPIGPFVADFYRAADRLVVEIDGDVHERGDRLALDALRDAFLRENGYRVLRIAAADVLRDPDAVAASIVALASRPLHHSPAASGPPPRSGEE